MTITIGNDSFDVISLSQLNGLHRAAIYTIWTYDPQAGNYPILYVGETGDVDTRLDSSHHKYQSWKANEVSGLFVGVKFMPSNLYTKEQRLVEEKRLIDTHNPICNG